MFENEKQYKAYIDGMDQYIEHLKKMRTENQEQARKDAVENLIESGIFNLNGTPKKKICN